MAVFRNLYEQSPLKFCGRNVVHGDYNYRTYCATNTYLRFPQQNIANETTSASYALMNANFIVKKNK